MDIEYVVSKGDTLYGISKQFGVTIDDIVLQNSLTSTNLKIGQILQIPSREDYTVKKGDTLYSISKKYNVSVSDIILFNQLKNMILQVGQKIKIPSNSAVSSEYYTVQKGDTLYSIAKRLGIRVSDLIEINQLKNNTLSIGQVLVLKKEDSVPIGKSCYGEDKSEVSYIVKKGDTLYSISKQFGISVSTIKEKNNLSSNNLSIGQVLII